jgi:hypothetical protein
MPPEALLGEWYTVLDRGGSPQPVTLSIVNVTPGKTAGKMTFASPKRCYIDLEYGGPDRGRHIFYIIRFTNCFDYGRSDFIALSQVPGDDLAVATAEDAEEKRRRSAEILSKYLLGQSEPAGAKNADTVDEPATAADSPPQGPGRIVYAINLSGEVQDSAILKRQ